jgi:phage baseplate assembly protein gpV
MGISKKGSRLIKVNDVEYRWVVKSDDYGMSLVVESAENPGQRTIARIEYGNIISPWLVRETILYAIDRGWHPQEKGQQIVFRLEGIISRDGNLTGVPSEYQAAWRQVFQESQESFAAKK